MMRSSLVRLSVSRNVARRQQCSLAPMGAICPACVVPYNKYSALAVNPQEQHHHQQQRSFATAKKKKKMGYMSGTAGRVAIQEDFGKKRKSKKPRICSGCGTQVIAGQTSGGSSMFSTGHEAANASTSAKFEKRARFADLGDSGSTNFLCARCKALQSNNVWGAYDAIRDVDAKVFSQQLGHIVGRRRFGLCLVVADATDPEHSAPKHLRRSIRSTPAILILSKCDLVPRMNDYDEKKLSTQVSKITGNRFLATFCVSAQTGAGILDLAEYLLHNVNGRDVFCVGAANVGKSTLVQRLAATITPNIYLRGSASRAHKRKEQMADIPVTASHLPGTTLQAVRVPCFASDRHALWDTPGIIQNKAVQYSLFAPHLMEPLARARPIALAAGRQVRAGCSILIEAAWMDPDAVEDDEHSTGDQDNDHDAMQKQLPPLSETCVLARMDVVEIQGRQGQNHGSIYIRHYLHPSLRVRTVRTDDTTTPTMATIPPHHVERVQARMRQAFGDDLVTSRPLEAYCSPQNPEGHLVPTAKECSNDGRLYMDVVFASLGWLHIMHAHGDFVLKPWCVQGSIFSKRPALYPINLSESDVHEQHQTWAEQVERLHSKEASRMLELASRLGRKQSGKSVKQDFEQGSNEYYDDDDINYW